MKIYTKIFIAAILAAATFFSSEARERKIHIVTTGDQHGAWFSEPYVEGQASKTSMMSVMYYVDSLRKAVGKDNVLLLDAGDCLQGDNAAYYFNYVKRGKEAHLFTRIASYMDFDAMVVGNHDIETGHKVYDKVYKELKKVKIPWLGGNAVKTKNGKPYFPTYTIVKKAGHKVAVLGFTNANMKAWLSEEVWKGMDFLSLVPYVQEHVDKVIKKERPDVVVAVVHSGTGEGDGEQLENQGLDLLNTLNGVDVLVCAHDHRPVVHENNGAYLINGGARGSNVGHAVVTLEKDGRKLKTKYTEAEIVRMDKNKVDKAMERKFASDFNEVKKFTNQKVGRLAMDMRTRDAYRGMSDYINLVHTVQLEAKEAQISFAAPLTFDGTVKAGELIYNDMFTVYPYENQLFVLKLSGKEIKNYLEYSYETWIQTAGDHVLRISSNPDPRTGSERWSFVGRSYNFDSAAGLVYTVDVTKEYGSRVAISSLADGSAFDENAMYNVAMTSYRASGGGDLLLKGAGIDSADADSRVVARYPEIRDMVYDYVKKHKTLTSKLVGQTSVIGQWRFVPEAVVAPLMEKDMNLIF